MNSHKKPDCAGLVAKSNRKGRNLAGHCLLCDNKLFIRIKRHLKEKHKNSEATEDQITLCKDNCKLCSKKE